MISSALTRTSAMLLAASGLPLLFAPDVVLPWLVPTFPVSASWLGQLIAAGWLSIALHNWNSRATIIGGIYARPLVNLNLVLYVVSALALLKVGDPTLRTRMVSAAWSLLAVAYGVVLLRGPFDTTTAVASHRRADHDGADEPVVRANRRR